MNDTCYPIRKKSGHCYAEKGMFKPTFINRRESLDGKINMKNSVYIERSDNEPDTSAFNEAWYDAELSLLECLPDALQSLISEELANNGRYIAFIEEWLHEQSEADKEPL